MTGSKIEPMAYDAPSLPAIIICHVLPGHSRDPIVCLAFYKTIDKVGLFEVICSITYRYVVVGQLYAQYRMPFQFVNVRAGIKIHKTDNCVGYGAISSDERSA